ncbi:hypothetical protein [Actinoplanes sp. NPDC089786]|uniref:hypothetical protein n=1 Tax=Actinoplanes sp. NPDC089786 TaxID=3155185 RepID=UPI00343ACCF6
MSGVDVLIVTALREEFDAVRRIGPATSDGEPGIANWVDRDDDAIRYGTADYLDRDGARFSLALARPERMGVVTTSAVLSMLAGQLEPRCIAMCGVCAGNPKYTTVGDVVVADYVFSAEEGKRRTEGLSPDFRHYQAAARILKAAELLSEDAGHLPSFGAPTSADRELWILDRLHAGEQPLEHIAYTRYFSDETWPAMPYRMEADGLISFTAGRWRLTGKGRELLARRIQDAGGGPARLPFNVLKGQVATLSAVREDPDIWTTLTGQKRSVVALDMEAVTVAQAARTAGVPYWMVVKGVMDHAGPDRDDRYKQFAATASAEVLFDLLGRLAHEIAPKLNRGMSGGAVQIRADLAECGSIVWTDADFAAGRAESDDDDPPLDEGETVDVFLLRSGGLHNLQRHFDRLGEVFDVWLKAGHRKRKGNGLRVFWVVGPGSSHRSRALLALLSRAGGMVDIVCDADRDIGRAAASIKRLASARAMVTGIVGLDLVDTGDAGWGDVRTVLRRMAYDPMSPTGSGSLPLMVIGGTSAQEQQVYRALGQAVELSPHDVAGNSAPSPASDAGAFGMASDSLPDDDIYYRGLPSTTRDLYGREADLNFLRAAWNDRGTSILCIAALGGVGKSSLVNYWLREMRGKNYPGVRKLLAWSFYSQGTKDGMVSAEPFMIDTLHWYGVREADLLSAPDRARRLAEHIRSRPTLVILDGVEPLQYPLSAPDVGGQFTDSAMTMLIDELAEPGWGGLCLMTTRVRPTALEADAAESGRGTVRLLELGNLDPAAGADLLRHIIGGPGPLVESELLEAVRDVDGHALAVNLLGRYVRDVHAGRLSGRLELRGLAATDGGGHARRIMEKYAGWLTEHRCTRELEILSIIGLFDRPAPPEEMSVVLSAIRRGSHGGNGRVGDPEWNDAVDKLREMGLVSDELPELRGTLDAHPLVREHFRDRMRQHSGDLWRLGHAALFDYYQRKAPAQPEDAAKMNLLYTAVHHGCAIERHQEVFDNILVPRVWRGTRESFSTRRLGMVGSEVVALSHYVRLPRWNELRDLSLTLEAEVTVMSNASLRLRQLGRLGDARASCGALLDVIDDAEKRDRPGAQIDGRHLAEAAFAASLYTELLVIAGALESPKPEGGVTAELMSRRAMTFADRASVPYFQMYARSCHAEVAFMLGKLDEADDRFAEAKAVDGSDYPFVYSQNTYRYGYYLIDTGRAREIVEQAEDPGWALNGKNSSQLSRALRPLVVGAAARSMVEQGEWDPDRLVAARPIVDDAIVRLRSVGYADYVVRGLLERSHLLRIGRRTEDYATAVRDLAKAAGAAAGAGMRLLMADSDLQWAALDLAYWPVMTSRERVAVGSTVRDRLRRAGEQIEVLRYGRRRGMLRELTERAAAYGLDQGTSDTTARG